MWISVKDRLPEYGKDVLVSINSYSLYDNKELVERFIDVTKYLSGCWLSTFGSSEERVTHWQELPALPEDKI